ncbi:ANTAR domain-containing protein [Streptomyces sp. NPDC052101]|uniref:ANTAR domain-containing protein n=1 Tax=Streptomyces sp. NPDC052101 TaxID=3155763 RepID=UPI00341A9F0A
MEEHADRIPGTGQTLPAPNDRIRQLEITVSQLERAVGSHAVIDQAIGVIVAVGRVTAAEAWDILRETSMSANIKLRRVAELTLAWGETGKLAPEIRGTLSARLKDRLAHLSAGR